MQSQVNEVRKADRSGALGPPVPREYKDVRAAQVTTKTHTMGLSATGMCGMSVENNRIVELAAPTMPLSSGKGEAELIYVGFWRRLAAYALDLVILVPYALVAGQLIHTSRTAYLVNLILGTIIALGGCAGMSPPDNTNFQAVVAKSVSPGMPFVTGIKHLAKAGFICDDRGSAPAVTCTRMRQNTLPYACIQRVDLKTDPDRRTIVEVTPEPIVCAGL